MRIAHLADLHFKPEAFELCRASIETVIAEHQERPFDAIVIAGDTWDGPIQNSAKTNFAQFIDLMKCLADCAPVAIIYGTPSHDLDTSLNVFEKIRALNPIRILQPSIGYMLSGKHIAKLEETGPHEDARLLLLGVPEPNKTWLLNGSEATGKDDSDQAIRARLRALFLGLGGLRKQRSDLPCLLLYHGEIAGAKTGTGRQSEAGTGFCVTYDDLAATGADYIALGHIHEPQRIGDLQAYYPGSIYPADFGETHKAGCNVIEISRNLNTDEDLFRDSSFRVEVSRLDFPHPQRASIKAASYKPQDIVGKVVSFEPTMTAEERANFDPEAALEKLLAAGALPGSRVVPNVLAIETVRAGEIVEQKSLADKLRIWAESSDCSVPESAYAKARELERERTASGSGNGTYIRIDRLRLRGAIGIWKKSKKDEINLDLAALGQGVLALVGSNGWGKTTIMENMHPWPCMLTRDGALKDHFRLRDSCRDLYFTDTRTGWHYRALISIRADIASGQAEYYLSVDKGSGFEPCSGINGRKEPYEQAITDLFGSLEMYLQTAFVTQRANKYAPDLGQATQGQRKALFRELAGMDYLQGYADAAKAQGDAVDAEIVKLDAAIEATASVEAEIDRLTRERDEAVAAEMAALETARMTEAEVARLDAERQTLALRVENLERRASRRTDLQREIESVKDTLEAIDKELEGFREAAAGRVAAAAELSRLEGLEAQAGKLRAEKAGLDEAHRKNLEDYNRKASELRRQQQIAQSALDSARQRLAAAEQAEALGKVKIDTDAGKRLQNAQVALDDATKAVVEAEKASAAANKQLDQLRKEHAEARSLAALVSEIRVGQACPLCGSLDHPTPAHTDSAAVAALEARGRAASEEVKKTDAVKLEAARVQERTQNALLFAERIAEESALAESQAGTFALITEKARAAVEEARAALAAIRIEEPPVAPPWPGAEILRSLELELDFADIEGLRTTIADADAAAIRIEESGRRRADAESHRQKLVAEFATVAIKPEEDNLSWDLAAKESELGMARSRLAEAQRLGAGAHATIEAAKRSLTDAETRRAKRAAEIEIRTTKASELADWRLLERACGPNGIQALELDALAPSIAEIANRLLATFSSRYTIQFRTTRLAGKGSKIKQVEDFEIFIQDAEAGDEQTIDSLSGGEAVWIRKALYSAFGIIRARNTDRKFLTVFLDEADGALDPEARMLYLRMLEAEHKEAGRYQTLIVTHSRELQAMVERTIEVSELGAQVQEELGTAVA